MTRIFKPARESPNLRRLTAMTVVHNAEQHAAQRFGEVGRNNDGEDIRNMRANDGTGNPADTKGPWCASYISWQYVITCEDIGDIYGMEFPVWFRTSRGAARLVDSIIASVGRKIRDATAVERGDVLLRRRSGGHHVMIATASFDVERKAIPMVDANRGPYPACVQLGYLLPGALMYAARPY